MALIEKSKEGRKDGGYTRLFNNVDLGALLSRCQATVISSGSELEPMVFKHNFIPNLGNFFENVQDDKITDGIYICSKKVFKIYMPKLHKQPDGLVFLVKQRRCLIIELKDGDQFDTKKVVGERLSLEKISNEILLTAPFTTEIFFCSFNATSREQIVAGTKKAFSLQEVLTGKELCELLEISYDDIVAERKKDAEQNLIFFGSEIKKILP